MTPSSSAAISLEWGSSSHRQGKIVIWNEERNQQLKDLWEAGLSAAEIGEELGCSRNSVLGKKFRLRLDDRPHTPAGEKKVRATQSKVTKSHTRRFSTMHGSESIAEPPPLENAVSIVMLEDCHCRYPAGYGEDHLMLYCGAPRKSQLLPNGNSSYDGPYCRYHNQLAYQR